MVTYPSPTYQTITLGGGLTYATWTTSGRPTSPSTGESGFNTTTGSVETYNGTSWVSAGSGNVSNTGTPTVGQIATWVNSGTVQGLSGSSSGQVLEWNGTIWTPGTVSSGGVTSVQVSGGSTGLTTTGGPVTTSGTITFNGTLAVASGGTGTGSAGGTALDNISGFSTVGALIRSGTDAWMISESFVTLETFGAVGNGTTDCTSVINSLATYFPHGGTVYLTPGSRYLIAGNAMLGIGITLKGPYGVAGPNTSNSQSPDFSASGGFIINSSYSLTLDASAGLDGCVVQRQGMTYPVTTISGFAGTAIIWGGDSAYIRNCLIVGFNQACSSNGFQRGRISNCYFDNLSNVYINNSQDVWIVENCHAWPFTTDGAGSVTGRTTGYEINGSNDWTRFIDCFAYGYASGFIVSSSDSVNLIGCGADTCSSGFLVQGNGVDVIFTACQAGGCTYGFYYSAVPSAASGATFTNCDTWLCSTAGISIDVAVNNTFLSVTGGNHRGNGMAIQNNSSAAKGVVTGVVFIASTTYAIQSSSTMEAVGCILNGGSTSSVVNLTACLP